VRTVSRAAPAGRPKARSVIGLKGGGSAGGRGFGGGLPPVLPKARSAVGLRGCCWGSPLPAVNGDRAVPSLAAPLFGRWEGAQLQWHNQKFVKGAGVKV
jgi:hypothetical protein